MIQGERKGRLWFRDERTRTCCFIHEIDNSVGDCIMSLFDSRSIYLDKGTITVSFGFDKATRLESCPTTLSLFVQIFFVGIHKIHLILTILTQSSIRIMECIPVIILKILDCEEEEGCKAISSKTRLERCQAKNRGMDEKSFLQEYFT